MSCPIPKWITRLAVIAVGLLVISVVFAKFLDPKKWFRSQLAMPHGPGGLLIALTMPMYHKVLYGPAAELLNLQPDDELLDVACGSGAFLSEQAGHVNRVAGLDLSDVQVNLARRRLNDRCSAGTAEVVQGDAADLPWEDDSFTAATCLGSLEFFPDPGTVLREIERVLQPGGRIAVTYGIDEANEDFVRGAERMGIPHPPEAQARQVIEGAGFSSISITYLDGDYPARFLRGIKQPTASHSKASSESPMSAV